MTSLTLNNLPDDLLKQLQQRAEKEQTTVQEQALYLLCKALDIPLSLAKAIEQFRKEHKDLSDEDAELFNGTRADDVGREVLL